MIQERKHGSLAPGWPNPHRNLVQKFKLAAVVF